MSTPLEGGRFPFMAERDQFPRPLDPVAQFRGQPANEQVVAAADVEALIGAAERASRA